MTNSRDLLPAGGVKNTTAWTLDNPSIPSYGVFSVSAQDISPQGVFFRADGLRMYVIGSVGDTVYQYVLATAWEVNTASFNQSFSVAAQESIPRGIFFKPDGLKMYVIGSNGDAVYEYDLSTAWNVITASYLQSFSVAAEEADPSDVFFKPDGLKMYVIGFTGDEVNEYDLSTAWNVSTASYVQTFSVAAQEIIPSGVFFKSDGLKMYVIGNNGRDVNEYDLSSAWDISTASYLQNFSVAAQDTFPNGVFFKPDGLKMYVIGSGSAKVYEYDLSSAWNVSTAAWVVPANSYFSVVAQEAAPNGLFFKPDGLKMYVIGQGGDDVNEYDLSTAWNVSTASYLQNFSIAAEETFPQGVFFKPDGLKMYVIGNVGDDVNEYDLSLAWDISTASFLQSSSVAAQDTCPNGHFFRADGLKMYVIGFTGDAVYEYDLSTAWDVSTTSYVQNFSVAAQETSPTGVFFSPNGFKMYVIGSSGDDVNEYDLNSVWDVSTASYVQNFSVSLEETSPQDVFFKPDGAAMYVVGSASDAVWAYSLI